MPRTAAQLWEALRRLAAVELRPTVVPKGSVAELEETAVLFPLLRLSMSA